MHSKNDSDVKMAYKSDNIIKAMYAGESASSSKDKLFSQFNKKKAPKTLKKKKGRPKNIPPTLFKDDTGRYIKATKEFLKGNYLKEHWNYINSLLSEKDKDVSMDNEEEFFSSEIVKKFYWFKNMGYNQTRAKIDKFQRLEDLANGKVNLSDFINSEEVEQLKFLDPRIKFNEEDVDLEFFPIMPNIINRMEGALEKQSMNFVATAVNQQATNDILEQRNAEIRSMMEELLIKRFESNGQAKPEEVRAQVEQKLKYYSTEYRHELEQWANLLIKIEDQKFNMKTLNKTAFRDLLIHETPFIHVNLIDDYYYPEKLNSEYCFYMKGPKIRDASDYSMFGWFSFETLSTILNHYQLDEEQITKLNTWSRAVSSPKLDGQEFFDNSLPEHNVMHNIRWMRGMNASTGDYNDPSNRMLRITTIYWLEPKKVGIVYVMIDGVLSSLKVDDNFKVTRKPKYKYNRRIKEELVDGEHVEWHYINELYKGVEISPDYGAGGWEARNSNESMFISFGKHPIQYSHKSLRYGVKIPVHGGSVLGWSVNERGAPWQRLYNYLGNRTKQNMFTELGKFVILNQNLFSDRSPDGSLNENALLTSFIQAKEMGLMTTDSSMVPGVGPMNSQGFGQEVDLTRTGDSINKLQLMRAIKQECYESLGLTANSVVEESPYQTAQSAAYNQNVSVTQLNYIYSRHYEIMKSVRETMLETALYLTSKGFYRELNHVSTDNQRHIFKLGVTNTLLYELAIFIDNDINDNSNLERIKNYVASTNTIGADSTEIATIFMSNSTSDLMGKLKDLSLIKREKEDIERAHQEDMQRQALEAQDALKEKELAYESQQAELDRINTLEAARIKALGFGNSTSGEIFDELIKVQNLKLKEADYERSVAREEFERKMKESTLEANNQHREKKIMSDHELRIAELDLKREKLLNEKYRTEAMLLASNNADKIQEKKSNAKTTKK